MSDIKDEMRMRSAAGWHNPVARTALHQDDSSLTRLGPAIHLRSESEPALAHRLGSSQSRIAKMEAADRSVSLDLIMRSLLTIGATATDIAKWIKRAETARAA